MGHQLTFTAVEKSGDSRIQELPVANSSTSVPWSDWEAAVGLLEAHPELQEELLALRVCLVAKAHRGRVHVALRE